MNASYFFVLTIGFSALMMMNGTGNANPFNPAFQQTSSESAAKIGSDHPRDGKHPAAVDIRKYQMATKPSDLRQDGGHVSVKNHLRSPANLSSANRPKKIPNSREYSASENAMKLRQTGVARSSGSKGTLNKNETANDARPIHASNVARSAAPSLNNVRHRGANPAVVGGSAISGSRNTGAISGTRINRKP